MRAKIYLPTKKNLQFLGGILKAGGLVAAPTETVYGLAANALDPKACAKIFRAKGRPSTDPLIVHVLGIRPAAKLARINKAATILARKFWPGPLTMILEKKETIPYIVTSGQESVALRSPKHAVFRKLLREAGIPLAAPSANPFGRLSPTSAEHVLHGLGKRIQHIVNGGRSQIGVESTIIDLRNPAMPVILRPGAITAEQLSDALGVKVHRSSDVPKANRASILAPGMLTQHYSPNTELVLHAHFSKTSVENSPNDEAWIFLAKPSVNIRPNIFTLEGRKDLRRAAKLLFLVLQTADQGGFKKIHIELAPEYDIGIAINDRLRRAAARA